MEESSNTKRVRIQLIGKNGKMGQMIQELTSTDPEVEVVEDGDVVIDFSSPSGTEKAIQLGKPLVCGTTGLSPEIFDLLKSLSQKVPVLYSPNFSLGIALMFQMLKGARHFKKVLLTEAHHIHKKDAPSGTAIKMAEILGIETSTIESIREGEITGTHEVKFLFEEEELQIRHEAYSRKAFAKGALFAAKFISNRSPKFYTLEDLFG